MALRRRIPFGLTALAAGLAAIAALPPRPLPDRASFLAGLVGFNYDVGRLPERGIHRSTLSTTEGELRARLERARRADSIVGQARAGRQVRSRDGMVTVVYEPPLRADSARTWLRNAVDEIEAYPRVGGGVAPVFLVLYSDSARHPGPWVALRRFARSAGGTQACFIELNLIRRRRQEELAFLGAERGPSRNVLDFCALYARYGPPGPRLAQWLGTDRQFNSWWDEGLTAMMRQASRERSRHPLPTLGFPNWAGASYWEEKGCLHNAGTLCLRAVGMDRARRRDTGYFWFNRFASPRYVLALLLARRDAEKFRVFWQSQLPPAEALSSAYVGAAGSFLSRLMNEVYAGPPSGPGADLKSHAAALGWVVTALGLAFVVARRRQVN